MWISVLIIWVLKRVITHTVLVGFRTAMAKRMTKMQQILDKFSGGGTLTDIQKRHPLFFRF